ncbi:hypothetical protein NYE48_02195 [Paenibacillus sp. FSL M7-1455]|jgi:hypothetical protein|uniref:Uncharacterized protein n=1 Tax=Paenibacillus cookii TaxID=157839 RepID=A0ABQ4LTP2_9BACL|nr:hypothetical protein [Paenibacillus cookii]GIO66614.1 hypothetical protein J21TS3_14350 [Paenibacillus cookii]
MIKLNRKVILLTFVIFILITGTSVYASGVLSSLFPTIGSEHQDIAKSVQDRLTQSWNKGREIILETQRSEEGKASATSSEISKDLDLSNWTFIDVTQLQDELSSFSAQERSSFLDAFYSEERKNNLDVGDYMPALLINPDKSHALVYWEKANGSYVVMDLKTKSNDSNSWYVNEVKIKAPKK